MKLSRFLKIKRKSLGMTQQDLAWRAGVGLRFIRDMEQEKAGLRLDKINQVLDLFGYKMAPVSVKQLDDEEGKSIYV